MATESFSDFRRKFSGLGPKPEPQDGSAGVLTVSEVARRVTVAIQAGLPDDVRVRGQLSNVKVYGTSVYFTLKDEAATLNGVLFGRDASSASRQALQDGQDVVVVGRVQAYGSRSVYQIRASEVRPVGMGALEVAFRKLKEKLQAEGLFAPERKRPIPRFPERIVLVTSSRGAALQDMLKIFASAKHVDLMLLPVAVQGAEAAPQIVAAMDLLAANAASLGVDMVIVARGGGSLEDLWAFNEEAVARAISQCPVPVVTGIGHEVDFSISDFVADLRAPTPTAAAQEAIQNWVSARDSLPALAERLSRSAQREVEEARDAWERLNGYRVFTRPMEILDDPRQRVDDCARRAEMASTRRVGALRQWMAEAERRLAQRSPMRQLADRQRHLGGAQASLIHAVRSVLALQGRKLAMAELRLGGVAMPQLLELRRERVAGLGARLERSVRARLADATAGTAAREAHLNAVAPQRVLGRGFTITRSMRTKKLVASAADTVLGETLETQFADGVRQSVVVGGKQLPLFGPPPGKPTGATGRKPDNPPA